MKWEGRLLKEIRSRGSRRRSKLKSEPRAITRRQILDRTLSGQPSSFSPFQDGCTNPIFLSLSFFLFPDADCRRRRRRHHRRRRRRHR